MSRTKRVYATIVILWVAVVAGATVWFAANPTLHRGPVRHSTGGRSDAANDLQEALDRGRGYSLSEGFNTTSFVVTILIATAVAGIAIMLVSVWAKGDES